MVICLRHSSSDKSRTLPNFTFYATFLHKDDEGCDGRETIDRRDIFEASMDFGWATSSVVRHGKEMLIVSVAFSRVVERCWLYWAVCLRGLPSTAHGHATGWDGGVSSFATCIQWQNTPFMRSLSPAELNTYVRRFRVRCS